MATSPSVDLSAATPRQMEVLRAYMEAGSMKAAAHALGISVQAVKNHLGELYKVTGARNIADAAYVLGSTPKV